MATVHITRDEAIRDIDALISRANEGEEIVIDSHGSASVVLKLASAPHVRLLSESLKMARERGSTVTLDDEFEKDLTEIINGHREPIRNLWD